MYRVCIYYMFTHPPGVCKSVCFRYVLAVLSDLAAKQNITDISDDHIVAWANEKVGSSVVVG